MDRLQAKGVSLLGHVPSHPRRSVILVLALVAGLAACARPPTPTNQVFDTRSVVREEVVSMTPLRWRMGAPCVNAASDPVRSRQGLADSCPDAGPRDFVAMAISGGGSKASMFGGEVMFMLSRLGLLDQVDMISGVSGGSFAAALYAASCDPADAGCHAAHPGRPTWEYDEMMRRLGQGYRPLVRRAYARLAVPLQPQTITPNEFDAFIEGCYLGTSTDTCDVQIARRPSTPLTFADLNPRRPHLVLNSTTISGYRDVVDDDEDCPAVARSAGRTPGEPRRYLRRRNSDEFFHFAFTDFYFRRLCSDLSTYRLSSAIGASAAFPALIDFYRLSDFTTLTPIGRARRTVSQQATDQNLRPALLLTDGGANDNQGLMEIYMALAEIAGRQSRSEIRRGLPEHRFEALRPGDNVLIFVVNSSLTESTGIQLGPDSDPSDGSAIVNVFTRAFAAIDTYSAVAYSTRTRLYMRELALLNTFLAQQGTLRRRPNLLEIGLTVLNRYPLGGHEAARHHASRIADLEAPVSRPGRIGRHGGTPPQAFDPDQDDFQKSAISHRRSMEVLSNPEVRRDLELVDIHPQCLFEKSKGSDISLASMTPNQARCLRHAARWATALRVQELCDQHMRGERPLNQPHSFDQVCRNGQLTPLWRYPAGAARLEDCRLDDPGDPDAAEMRRFLVALEDPAARTRLAGTLAPTTQCRIAAPEAARAR